MTHQESSFEILKKKVRELTSTPTLSGQVELLSIHEKGLIVEVRNKFVRDWLRENFQDLIEQEAFTLLGTPISLQIQLKPGGNEPDQAPSLPVSEGRSSPLPSGLNPKYTFESFVVGTSNQFAHAASQAISKNPAQSYNPLFMYGGVGLGKTHLLNAIGHSILKGNPEARVVFVSGERFVNELIHSLRFEKMGEFRKKYREGCDLLLLDDVQFIGGKGKSQEEFFHTFNHLHESARQIVLTSDKVPREIPGLEERLRSRFEWGLMADLQVPDLETRVAILKKKADLDQIRLDDEVALFLGTHITSNVRELEGALIRVNAFAALSRLPITVPFAKEVLKNVVGGIGKVLTVEQVQKVVSEFYGVKITDLTGKRRIRGFAGPRQIAMYLCRRHVKASYPDIGSRFGGKDHSTVVHAVTKIERKIQEDPKVREQILTLEQHLL